MRKRFLLIIVALVAVFVVGTVGASVLGLNGSNSAPGESKTEAACASNLVVKTPVATAGHDANSIDSVDITGDLSKCIDQTLRAEVDLDVTNAHIWAVHKITAADAQASKVTLTINTATGDFYTGKPVAQSGELVPTGARSDLVSVKNFGLTTITIAQTWE